MQKFDKIVGAEGKSKRTHVHKGKIVDARKLMLRRYTSLIQYTCGSPIGTATNLLSSAWDEATKKYIGY